MPVRMIKQLVSELTKVRERLENRETFGAVLIVAMGLLARLWATTGTYLDPDEALCYMQANQTSLPLAYKASLNVVHPPLLIFGLYYIRHLGTSELILRLPSVIAGTAFCWVAYKWVARLLGRTAGWIGLIFFAFLPPLIEFSAEVRQYALLLCRNDVTLIDFPILGDALPLLRNPLRSCCRRIRLGAHRKSAPSRETHRFMGDRPNGCVGTLVGLLRYTYFEASRKWAGTELPRMDADFLYP